MQLRKVGNAFPLFHICVYMHICILLKILYLFLCLVTFVIGKVACCFFRMGMFGFFKISLVVELVGP